MSGLWRRIALAAVLLCACLWGGTDAVQAAKGRERLVRKEKTPDPTLSPVERIPKGRAVDMSKLWGKWYLLNFASKCPRQLRRGSRAESTFIEFTPPEQPEVSPISVSTSTRFNHDCWEIIQKYYPTATPGHYFVKGKTRSEPNTDIIIMELDDSYAFILYHRNGKVTIKLYGRSTSGFSEPMIVKFEKLAQGHGMGLAFMFPFPNFGHCGSVDQRHVIDCAPLC